MTGEIRLTTQRWQRFFVLSLNVQTNWEAQVVYLVGTRAPCVGGVGGMKLTTHPHLVLRLKMHRARVTQIAGARLPWQLNFVHWCLIFVDPQYVTCFSSVIWHLEF
jgi:hypothetical protein